MGWWIWNGVSSRGRRLILDETHQALTHSWFYHPPAGATKLSKHRRADVEQIRVDAGIRRSAVRIRQMVEAISDEQRGPFSHEQPKTRAAFGHEIEPHGTDWHGLIRPDEAAREIGERLEARNAAEVPSKEHRKQTKSVHWLPVLPHHERRVSLNEQFQAAGESSRAVRGGEPPACFNCLVQERVLKL